MLEKYLQWDKAFEESVKESQLINYELSTEKVYFSGMGGSYIPGKIAEIFDLNVEYQATNLLPRKLNENTTLIAMSYSGNTSETIYTVKYALERKSKIVIITSGGILENIAKENSNIFLVKVKGDSQTRYSFPYLITPLLKILSTRANEKINLTELKEGITEFRDKFLNYGKFLSRLVISKVPVFYGSTYYPVAIRFKQEINENAKYPAFYGYIPEVNHNEVESYVRGKELLPVVIGNEKIDSVTKEVLNAEQIVPPSSSKLKNISALVFLAGITSIQLAGEYKEDPEKLYKIPKCRELTLNIFK